MPLFRILTEDINESNITRIASNHFPGFTLERAIGFWQGQQEPSAILKIDTSDRSGIMQVAHEIREANHQQSVMVEELPASTTFVDSDTPEDIPYDPSDAPYGDAKLLGDPLPI